MMMLNSVHVPNAARIFYGQFKENTRMLFGDAKKSVDAILGSV